MTGCGRRLHHSSPHHSKGRSPISTTATAAVWFRWNPAEPIGSADGFRRLRLNPRQSESMTRHERWTELAARWGIEPGYFDVQGRRREADERNAAPDRRGAVRRPAIRRLRTSAAAASPEPAFQGDGRKIWVLAVQLYGVRSRRNWGHGDFSDLADLLEIVAGSGRRGDRAQSAARASSTIARMLRQSVFAEQPAVSQSALHRRRGDRGIRPRSRRKLRRGHRAAARRRAGRLSRCRDAEARALARSLSELSLRAAARARRARFRRLSGRARPRRCECFAAFETLRAQHSGAWWDWPEPWRTPSDDDACANCATAIPTRSAFTNSCNGTPSGSSGAAAISRAGAVLPIGLYLDTAIGVDAAGADAWMEQGVDAARAVGRRAARPVQSRRPGLGPDRLQSARSCRERLRAVPPDAARRHALRRRGAHRSCARADAALRHSRMACRRGAGRLSAAAVRRHAGGRRRGKPALALHRHRRGPRHRAGGFPRHAVGLGRVVLSGR